jgi:flagellar basal body-associated protein FliL
MDQDEDSKRGGDVRAWVTIAVIDAVATAALCGIYFWLSTTAS